MITPFHGYLLVLVVSSFTFHSIPVHTVLVLVLVLVVLVLVLVCSVGVRTTNMVASYITQVLVPVLSTYTCTATCAVLWIRYSEVARYLPTFSLTYAHVCMGIRYRIEDGTSTEYRIQNTEYICSTRYQYRT